MRNFYCIELKKYSIKNIYIKKIIDLAFEFSPFPA